MKLAAPVVVAALEVKVKPLPNSRVTLPFESLLFVGSSAVKYTLANAFRWVTT